MTTPDWIVLIAYLIGTVAVGVLLGKLVKNTRDLFAAGRQSPWWMSGLSAFMTMERSSPLDSTSEHSIADKTSPPFPSYSLRINLQSPPLLFTPRVPAQTL